MNNDSKSQAGLSASKSDDRNGEDVARLTAEIDRLKQQLQNYTNTVGAKVDSIEEGMDRLMADNQRLVELRASAEVERDACVALAVELALAAGFSAGALDGATAVIELPKGQVSWEIAPSEAHLIARLPRYEGKLEQVDIAEKYERVMNSGVRPGGRA